MHVISLRIEDFKIIADLEIYPKEGAAVVVTGENAAGKTTMIDAVMVALCGAAGMPEPIRRGAAKTRIRLEIGEKEKVEYLLQRSITKRGAYLDVRRAEDDSQVASPQGFLDHLRGSRLVLDPLEFDGMKPKEQAELIRKICGLDCSDLEKERADAYEARRIANVSVTKLEAQLKATPRPGDDVPDAETSAKDVLDDLSAKETTLSQRRELVFLRDSRFRAKAAADAAIEALKAQLADAERVAADLETSHKLADDDLAAHMDEHGDDAFIADAIQQGKTALIGLDEVNGKVRAKEQWTRLKAELRTANGEAQKFDDEIKKIDARKAERIKAADIPVAGLEVTDDGVLLNGIPYAQLSTGQRIITACTLVMAQKPEPELKFILLREASLLDDGNLQLAIDTCRARQYQIFIERVSREPIGNSFHIVDGTLTHANGESVDEK